MLRPALFAGLVAAILVAPMRMQPGASRSPSLHTRAVAAAAFSSSVTLVNDGGSSQNAGMPTQTFGLVFKQGDVPSNSAPVFTDGVTGHLQKYSWGLATYWSDGSLKRATFMLLPDFSVAGRGTKSLGISVSSGTGLCETDGTPGGAWPCPSSRTLAEVYNQNIVVSMPSAPVNGSRLGNSTGSTVTFSAWVDSAANTNNRNYKQVRWLDGDAGAAWRIDTKMSATKTGAAQSTLRMSEYVIALNNAAGGLGGFRHMPIVRQPAYNGNTLHWYGFATPDYNTPANGPNWTASGVSAQPLAWHGGPRNSPSPMVAQTFNVSNSTSVCNGNTGNGGGPPCFETSRSNNYWFGISGCQMIPFYITTSAGAVLPSVSGGKLDTDTIYYACSNQGVSPNPRLDFGQAPANGGALLPTTNGFGIFTMHPIPVIGPFTRIPFATNDGQYNFFQGTGSLTAETALRVKFDQDYWLTTKTLPPLCAPGGASLNWPTSCPIQGASNGGISGINAVQDSLYTGYDWNPINGTDWAANEQAAGDHLDIGPMNDNSIKDFYNQSKASLRVIRMNGLQASMGPFDIKDNAKDTVPNMLGNSYTGMQGCADTSWGCTSNKGFGVAQGGIAGNNYPFSEVFGGIQGVNISAQFSGEHRPSRSAWPFLRTGELQFLDMLEDVASQGLATVCANPDGTGDRNPTSPVAGDGIILGGGLGGEMRNMAWVWRDAALTIGFYPYDPTGTATVYTNGGTQQAAYWRQIGLNNAKATKDALNAANNAYGSSTSYLLARGKWQGLPTTGCGGGQPIGSVSGGGTWELAYLMFGANWYYALTEDSQMLDLINAYATRESYILKNFGGWFLYPYVEHNGVTVTNYVNPAIASDASWGVSGGSGLLLRGMSWTKTPSPSASVRAFSWPTICCGNVGYTPANGDAFMWNNAIGSTTSAPAPANITTPTTNGSVLHFASTPSGIRVGLRVANEQHPFNKYYTVSSFDRSGNVTIDDLGNAASVTTVSGDTIDFFTQNGASPVLTTATISSATTNGGTIHFANTPSGIQVGMAVQDVNHPFANPTLCTISSFDGSGNVTLAYGGTNCSITTFVGDTINFGMVMEGIGGQAYYIVDLTTSGNNYIFNMAASPGGARLPIVDTGSRTDGSEWFRPISPGSPGFGTYELEITGAMNWSKALVGGTGFNAPINNGVTLSRASSYNPATNCLDTGPPAWEIGATASCRYSWQNHFGR